MTLPNQVNWISLTAPIQTNQRNKNYKYKPTYHVFIGLLGIWPEGCKKSCNQSTIQHGGIKLKFKRSNGMWMKSLLSFFVTQNTMEDYCCHDKDCSMKSYDVHHFSTRSLRSIAIILKIDQFQVQSI